MKIMHTERKENMQENTFTFLKTQYSGLGVLIVILAISSGIMLLLKPYFPDFRILIPISFGSAFLIVYLYGSIAMFAHFRGGSPLGQIFRIIIFLIIVGMCVFFGLIHWAYGLACLIITTILLLILREEFKARLARQYSTRDQIFSNGTAEKGPFENAVKKLIHEVTLGPGYCQRVIGEHINDLRLAIALGRTEIDKGKQETTYMEMHRVMNMIAARLRNLSTEESLQQLETIARISELQYKIQQLNAGVSLSRLLAEAQKHELLLQIAQL